MVEMFSRDVSSLSLSLTAEGFMTSGPNGCGFDSRVPGSVGLWQQPATVLHVPEFSASTVVCLARSQRVGRAMSCF